MTEINEQEDLVDKGEHEARVKRELAAEVQGRVGQLIHGNSVRELIDTREALIYLVGRLGPELTTIVCALSKADLNSFKKLGSKRMPSATQKRNIAAAYMIVDIINSSVGDPQAAQEWLVSYNDYLYGIPAMEIRVRPEDVRTAVLQYIAGGV